MILHRVIEHVKAQNWTAVALDFVIVVVGVFIGIQVSNWNGARSEKKLYELARERLVTEIDANLETIAITQAELADVLPRVSDGIDALRSCAAGPESAAMVADAIKEAQLTRGHQFTQSALRDLTENAALLRQQTEPDRRAFQNLRNTVEQLQFEANFLEEKPLDEPIWRQPTLAMSSATLVDATYRGEVWRYLERDLSLSVPMEVACKDSALLASLYEYERLQSALDAVFTIATVEMSAVKALITDDNQQDPEP